MTTTQTVTVTGSQPTQGPGLYLIAASGVTLTLETWTHWHDAGAAIIVKCVSDDAPPITILAPQVTGGAVDGLASIQIVNPREALVFRPYIGGNTYSVTG